MASPTSSSGPATRVMTVSNRTGGLLDVVRLPGLTFSIVPRPPTQPPHGVGPQNPDRADLTVLPPLWRLRHRFRIVTLSAMNRT